MWANGWVCRSDVDEILIIFIVNKQIMVADRAVGLRVQDMQFGSFPAAEPGIVNVHDTRFSNPTKISNLEKDDHVSLKRQCLSVLYEV